MIHMYSELQEEIQSAVLPNGFRIYYIPKTEFQKTFAMLAVQFGSTDCCFTVGGQQHTIAPGVAHFLEHKMFEEEDGNALQKFTELGAQPNAFTSHTMTAYHFTATEHFEENLAVLLRFVTTPYFTDENVAKEKGIIEQEISMLEDTPSWQAYVGVLQGLYRTHTVRTSIAGSKESIALIDPELLYTCHRAFYSAPNLALIICGTCEFDRVCQMAQEIVPKESVQLAGRSYGIEGSEVLVARQIRRMAVSRPMYMLGIKDTPTENRYYRQLLGELTVRCICGESTPLYEKLYQEQLVDRTFSPDYFTFAGGACALFSGETRDPDRACQQILGEIERAASEGVADDVYERAWRQLLGLRLRGTDEPANICRQQAEACFAGSNCFDFYEMMKSVRKNDVEQRIQQWAKHNCSSQMMILPLEGAECHE